MADRRSEGVKGPSGSQALTVVTLFPVGGLLLTLAGLTLTASVVGLAVATPVFILFSPVLVPAALAIGLAVLGFLASGGFGVAGLSALSCVANQLRGLLSKAPEQAEQARRRAAEAAAQVGQRAKELGQGIQSRGQEGK